MLQTASMIALYRVLRSHGETTEQISELAYQIAEVWLNRYPRLVRKLIGRMYMSRWWRRRMRKRALASRARRYAGDFVYRVVEGDRQEFEWGINYLECGIVKFCHTQGVDEFTSYICRIDHLLFPAIGITLHRLGTLAQGCAYCDFRFSQGCYASTLTSSAVQTQPKPEGDDLPAERMRKEPRS
jgi:hypothetical protein